LKRGPAARAVYVGCAGWTVPPTAKHHFPAEGSHLARCAARFGAVEINSSFYGPHRHATYARWKQSVPAAFRFSVKVPKTITHDRRLVGVRRLLTTFLGQVAGLGNKLGCLLVQLPGSLEFKLRVAREFFTALREKHAGPVVLEPRHASWFTPAAEQLLKKFRIARAAADPAVVPAAAKPGGWPGFVYYRLHGSPRMYFSSYSEAYLTALASQLCSLARKRVPVWCVFDNTAYGVAAGNALDLLQMLPKVR
jgi:uncharacterized protein YecE (DUF72 family)